MKRSPPALDVRSARERLRHTRREERRDDLFVSSRTSGMQGASCANSFRLQRVLGVADARHTEPSQRQNAGGSGPEKQANRAGVTRESRTHDRGPSRDARVNAACRSFDVGDRILQRGLISTRGRVVQFLSIEYVSSGGRG